MIDLSTVPNVDVATANLIYGEMVDVTTPGDGTGTPVRKDWQSDVIYALYAIMNDAGITANGVAEGATASQFKDAILRVARKQVQGPSYSNLLVSRPSVSTVLVTFDKLWIEGVEKLSGSYTLNIANSGALGLDTGSEAANAWYYIWIIAKADGTVSAILSASSTAPTLPAGYIYKRLVSMVRNTGGNFVDFLQRDTVVYRRGPIQIATGNPAAFSGVNISTFIPSYLIVKSMQIVGYIPTDAMVQISLDGSSIDGIITATGGTDARIPFNTFYPDRDAIYFLTTGGVTATLFLTSYEIKI